VAHPDYYKLSSHDRLLYLSGVPLALLKRKIVLEKLIFQPSHYDLKDGGQTKYLVVSPNSQVQFAQALLANPLSLGNGGSYFIGSNPTDQSALDLALALTRAYHSAKFADFGVPKIRWLDLGAPDWDFLKNSEQAEELQLIVLCGISQDSDIRRLEIARDFFRASSSATRIMLVLCKNILEFVYGRLGQQADGVFQLGRYLRTS
jgi:hypothetical protein